MKSPFMDLRVFPGFGDLFYKKNIETNPELLKESFSDFVTREISKIEAKDSSVSAATPDEFKALRNSFEENFRKNMRGIVISLINLFGENRIHGGLSSDNAIRISSRGPKFTKAEDKRKKLPDSEMLSHIKNDLRDFLQIMKRIEQSLANVTFFPSLTNQFNSFVSDIEKLTDDKPPFNSNRGEATGSKLSGDKPEGNPEDKPEDKPWDKPEGNPEDKPEGNPEDKPEDKLSLFKREVCWVLDNPMFFSASEELILLEKLHKIMHGLSGFDFEHLRPIVDRLDNPGLENWVKKVKTTQPFCEFLVEKIQNRILEPVGAILFFRDMMEHHLFKKGILGREDMLRQFKNATGFLASEMRVAIKTFANTNDTLSKAKREALVWFLLSSTDLTSEDLDVIFYEPPEPEVQKQPQPELKDPEQEQPQLAEAASPEPKETNSLLSHLLFEEQPPEPEVQKQPQPELKDPEQEQPQLAEAASPEPKETKKQHLKKVKKNIYAGVEAHLVKFGLFEASNGQGKTESKSAKDKDVAKQTQDQPKSSKAKKKKKAKEAENDTQDQPQSSEASNGQDEPEADAEEAANETQDQPQSSEASNGQDEPITFSNIKEKLKTLARVKNKSNRKKEGAFRAAVMEAAIRNAKVAASAKKKAQSHHI